jgi:hypothetical protein
VVNEFGDFQTPLPLVYAILDILETQGVSWQRALEPTCGIGNFLQGVLTHQYFSQISELKGIEIQERYVAIAQKLEPVEIIQHDIFKLNLSELNWQTQGALLVIGNPPWVTNSDLGILDSQNLPTKSNLKQQKGIDALTGSSNFDLAEAVWIKLLGELSQFKPTIALLCKMSTARRILQYSYDQQLPISSAFIHQIDALKWFNVSVDACLLTLQLADSWAINRIPVFKGLTDKQSQYELVFQNQCIEKFQPKFSTNFETTPMGYEWRQGVKHDLASVMELVLDEDKALWNKQGQWLEIEDTYVYPLLKGTDVFHGRMKNISKAVIVTQQFLNQDTTYLENASPKLWSYLNQFMPLFEARKSSIYQGKPPFSMFGIGEYSFALYKIAISGFHKQPRFTLIEPFLDKPVMLDDTCYFLSFNDLETAKEIFDILNQPDCIQYLTHAIFEDAKRPITKKVLQRLNAIFLTKSLLSTVKLD